jgi:hypothetical protein
MTDENNAPESKPSGKRSMLQPLLAGGLILTGGILMVMARMEPEVTEVKSDKMSGITSISSALEASGALDAVVPLTFHDGTVDLLYVGAPECSHCQLFMDTGFEAMVSFAEENELDLAYMPMAMSAFGVSIAAVEHCAMPTATLAPAEILQEGYAFVPVLEKAMEEARELNASAPEGAASSLIESTIAKLHKKTGSTTGFDVECYEQTAAKIPEKMSAFASAFSLTGTPSFYHTSKSGGVFRTIGSPNLTEAKVASK